MTYTLAHRLSDIDTLVEEGVLEPSEGAALREKALRDAQVPFTPAGTMSSRARASRKV